jgi:branched-chain amino acid transport system ATP-binding protein
MSRAALEIQGLRAGYGELEILRGVDLSLGLGELVAVIGANGAGKSTLLKCISGLVRPRAGDLRFAGQPLSRMSPAAIVRLGVGHVPERRQIFNELTVADNLRLGAYSQLRRIDAREFASRLESACALFPALASRLQERAGNLSGGQQQMLAIARSLMMKPRLLLLDEPSLGLAPILVGEIFTVLSRLRGTGVAILLVEQNARLSLAIADRGYVLETGRVALTGAGSDLLTMPEVVHRYLGVGSGRSVEADRDEDITALSRRLNTLLRR